MIESALISNRQVRPSARSKADLPVPCTLLAWDTEFFGFSIARVTVDALTDRQAADVDDWCRAEGIRCLYFLARSDDPTTIRTAERHGFNLVDLRLTLERKVAHACHTVSSIRPACPADVPALQAIAQAAHRDTRFRSDPHFPWPLTDVLYSTWIKLECDGRAQRVFVATADEDQALGYISCHLDATRATGQIGLAAVSRAAQGRGRGKALVQAALSWFAVEGAEQVSVVTQGQNIPAQRLYQGCGFLSASMQLWFHKWFTSDD